MCTNTYMFLRMYRHIIVMPEIPKTSPAPCSPGLDAAPRPEVELRKTEDGVVKHWGKFAWLQPRKLTVNGY